MLEKKSPNANWNKRFLKTIKNQISPIKRLLKYATHSANLSYLKLPICFFFHIKLNAPANIAKLYDNTNTYCHIRVYRMITIIKFCRIVVFVFKLWFNLSQSKLKFITRGQFKLTMSAKRFDMFCFPQVRHDGHCYTHSTSCHLKLLIW